MEYAIRERSSRARQSQSSPKVVLKVLPPVQSGGPGRTRTGRLGFSNQNHPPSFGRARFSTTSNRATIREYWRRFDHNHNSGSSPTRLPKQNSNPQASNLPRQSANKRASLRHLNEGSPSLHPERAPQPGKCACKHQPHDKHQRTLRMSGQYVGRRFNEDCSNS